MHRMADTSNNAQRSNGSQHVETTNDPDKMGRSAAKKKSK
jgi:hypothetical protein